jgi:DivIVA domain-containing protein
VITVLWYLVIAALIGAVVFAIAVFVFGRGEQMAPLDPRTSPAELPDTGSIAAADVTALRFSVALRGYRMSDVDWALERIGDELDGLRLRQARLRELVVSLGGDPDEAERAAIERETVSVAAVPAAPATSTVVEAGPAHPAAAVRTPQSGITTSVPAADADTSDLPSPDAASAGQLPAPSHSDSAATQHPAAPGVTGEPASVGESATPTVHDPAPHDDPARDDFTASGRETDSDDRSNRGPQV